MIFRSPFSCSVLPAAARVKSEQGGFYMSSTRFSIVLILSFITFIVISDESSAQPKNVADRNKSESHLQQPMALGQGTPSASMRSDQRNGSGRSIRLAQADDRTSLEENALGLEESEEERTFEDDVGARQSIDAFNSLEDGQPGGPGEWELQLDFGWETTSDEPDPATIKTELKYTPDGSEFLRNMKLLLDLPFELGNGDIDGNADIGFGWQQRWVTENDRMPTLATLAEIRIPSGDDSSGVDGTLTGIMAKDLGPGTFYINAFAKTVNGNNIENRRDFQWGFRTGYKWRLDQDISFIADYLLESSEERGHRDINAFELSGQYRVNENLTIGPGILIGLDDNDETPNFGAGVRVTWTF